MPSTWWSSPRIRTYLLFDATGIIYFLVGFLAIKIVGQLGAGPIAWQAQMKALENPIYILFHVVALASVIFVAVRFFRLFPKAQPPAIGPAKPPPGPVIHAGLYVLWIGLTLVVSLALAGVIF
jgi:fumarate reductase subunit C